MASQESLIIKTSKELDLLARIEPVVESLKYELRDVEVLGSERSPIVRIILDHPEHTIGIEDCSKVHEILNPMFDVWDPFPGAYSLEVSSPGESPTLRTWNHFKKALGARVNIETSDAVPMPEPAKPRRRFDSTLKEIKMDQGLLVLEDSLGVFEIPAKSLKKAEWVRDWSPQVEKPTQQVKHNNKQQQNSHKNPRKGV